jgi:hypothetical protein
MRKVLYTLLAATTLTSTSFAASVTADQDAKAAGEPKAATVKETFADSSHLGIKIPPLRFDKRQGILTGTHREIILSFCKNATNTASFRLILRDTSPHVAMYELEPSRSSLKPCQELEEALKKPDLLCSSNFYLAVCTAVNHLIPGSIPNDILFQLRQITASIFLKEPNAWMMGGINTLQEYARNTVTGPALEEYHLPILTEAIRSRLGGCKVSEEAVNTIAKDTYHQNTTSSDCPEKIMSVFKRLSEILAIAAYNCRITNTSPTTILTPGLMFSQEVSAFITILFELDDKAVGFEELNILGDQLEIKGLPHLNEVQKEFATRWLETVLSPSATSTEALAPFEKDGFAFIPEIVARALQIWTEFKARVFGEKVSVIFSRIQG